MPYLTGIDPGVATGIVLGWYDLETPWERRDFWLVKNGIDGFLGWYHGKAPDQVYASTWVSELFVLRSQKFVANLEPVRIEGAMSALGLKPSYQDRTKKALCKDEVLKKHDLWVTGKMCDHTDGRDVNDAEIHSLAYLKTRHRPTLEKYWG